MFNSLIRYYNQNRGKIIFIIVIIIAIIVLIKLLNQFARNKNLAEQNVNAVATGTTAQDTSTKSANVLHTESQVSGGKITATKASENQTLIDNFVKLCNNGNVEEAYNCLSSNCKTEVFPTVDEFKSKYVDEIFSSSKQYNIENWKNNGELYTYKVTYVADMLSSGIVSDSVEDYITVVTENSELKLNIFRYITNVQIDKSESSDIATIQVIDKDVYDDYEIYNIKVTNNTTNRIMINEASDNGGIYVQYKGSEAKYTAFISEIIQSNLVLESNQTKYLSIKINKIYTGVLQASTITFSDIIKNKAAYDQLTNKSNYKDIITIQVNL